MGFLQWGGRGVSKAQQTPGQSETGKVRVASHRPLGFEICLLCLAKWCLGFAQGSREWLAQKLVPHSKGARATGSPQMPGLGVSREIVPSIAPIRVSTELAKCQNEHPPSPARCDFPGPGRSHALQESNIVPQPLQGRGPGDLLSPSTAAN